MISFSSNVWFRNDEASDWERGSVVNMLELPLGRSEKVQRTKFSVELQSESGQLTGEVVEVVSKLVEGSFEEFELVKLRNPADDDAEAAGQVEDLITLNHLHEPAILTCLRRRFDRNLIYTNTGPILIAVVRYMKVLRIETVTLT